MKVQIFGERCSGTNYLEDLLNENGLGLEVTSEYGHKHMFNGFKPRKRPDGEAVYIFMYRNPYDWLRSVALKPHHTRLWDLEFSDFIRRAPWECDVYEGPGFKGEYGRVIERYEGTVLDVRNSKNRVFDQLWLPGRSYNVRYEDLRRDPEATLRKIGVPLRAEFRDVKTTRKEEDHGRGYQRKTYVPISESDLSYINTSLDWAAESRIGYHMIQSPGTELDYLLKMLYG